jgi:hypothetical protein
MIVYVQEEIRAAASLAHTCSRMAVQYNREGNEIAHLRYLKSARFWIEHAKTLKMLAIREAA